LVEIMKRSVLVLALVLGSAQTICPHRAMAQTGTSATGQADSSVQSIDGGAGPCSVTLTATSDSKPLVAADVKVHIEYGFAGIRRLDLEAYTGNDGRVKFTGLPAKVRRPPLIFRASKDALAGTAVYNPETECKAEHEVVLVRPAQNQN
jgi:hypothetical protein